MAATGPIATFSTVAGGSGYTTGLFSNIPLGGGHGSGAQAQITVAAGTVTGVSLTPPSQITGKNYQVADALTLEGPNWIGPGTGFSVTVGSLAAACENCIFGRIVPDTATNTSMVGRRYCGYDAFNNIQPGEGIPSDPYAKLITEDAFWCGEGADLVSGLSFASLVQKLPSVGNPGVIVGFFNTAPGGAAFFDVTETRIGPVSQIDPFPANAIAAAFVQAHGLFVAAYSAHVGFRVQSGDGTNFAGTENFGYLGA